MRVLTLFKALLGVEHMVVESVALEALTRRNGQVEQVLVARVRPSKRRAMRCSRCQCRCSCYDTGDGRRRWRSLDMGSTRVYLEADAPRVRCRRHGVVVAAVPWASPGSRFTAAFEDTTAWLTKHATMSTVAELLRVGWKSVHAIVTRVVARLAARRDPLDGLRRIGVDELAYRKGHRYLLVVVDHDTGTLVWAREGRNAATLNAFFDDLGAERAAQLTHVSADGAEWIHTVVGDRAPAAVLCLDPFHVVGWATKALDQLRRRLVADLRRVGRTDLAASLKGSRWALLKNPYRLKADQRTTLASIQIDNKVLYRAYLLKEQLRAVFDPKGSHRRGLLAECLHWARRCRIPEFVKLAESITRYRPLIWNTIAQGLSNARSEATNTHLRALTKRAYGFHTPDALIAMALLTRGGCCPPLPDRSKVDGRSHPRK